MLASVCPWPSVYLDFFGGGAWLEVCIDVSLLQVFC